MPASSLEKPNVICVKSFVPNEKNSAVSAISPANRAARGISIIVPTLYVIVLLASALTTLATYSNSLGSPTSGTMISGTKFQSGCSVFTFNAALMIARACIAPSSGYVTSRRHPL